MKLNNIFSIQNFSLGLLYLSFMGFGFGKAIFFILPLFIYYLIFLTKLKSVRLNRDYIFLTLFYILFLSSAFIIGADNMTLDEKSNKIFISVLGILIFSGLPFQLYNFNIKYNLLGFYIFGMFLYSIIVVTYNYDLDPVGYGYGKLMEPFSGEESNSPFFANMIAIAVAFFYPLLFFSKRILIKIICIAVVFLSLLGGIYLRGRLYFIILFLTIIFCAFIRFNKKNLFKFFIILATVFIILFYLIINNEHLLFYSILFLNRFSEEGLSSPRFDLYMDGLEKLIQNPFGGFQVGGHIGTTWFHNIFLDTGRVAGWIPIILFLFAIFYSLKFIFYRNKYPNFLLSFWIYLVIFLEMQQDVILEGNPKILILFYLASLAVVNSKKVDIEENNF